MSFLADPPMLVVTGAAIERTVDDPEVAKRLEIGTLVVFLVVSVSLYLNLPWVRRFWEFFGEKSGRDFMFNSGVLPCDASEAGAKEHLLAAGLFATYPIWLKVGRHLGRKWQMHQAA